MITGSNLLGRSLSGVLVLPLLVTLTGRAQAPSVPAGEGRISGRILTSTSQPIADATVLLGLNETGVAFESSAWFVATSDQNGLYEFGGLPAGPFILIAAKRGYVGWDSIPMAVPAPIGALRRVPALAFVMSAPRLAIDLVPGGRVSEANVTLHRPASVSGRAVYPDGSPAAMERVTLYTADDTGAISSRRDGMPTDAGGAYSFSDLHPGVYYLGLPPPGRLQDLDPSALTPVTVAEGMSHRNVDVPIITDGVFSVSGRVVDAFGQVPRLLQLEYGVPGATHRGLLSVSNPDGRFHIREGGIVPGPLTIIGRGENDEGPVIGFLTLTTIDGPNDVEIVVSKPGGLRGRVSMEGGVPLTAVGARLALVREGFTPLGASDDVIEIAPDGWLEADNLIGEYRVRVDEPQRWTVKALRRRGLRVANDRLVIRNAEILDEIEILIGPR
jgi:Carboxypeptidase regulatory-like domain